MNTIKYTNYGKNYGWIIKAAKLRRILFDSGFGALVPLFEGEGAFRGEETSDR